MHAFLSELRRFVRIGFCALLAVAVLAAAPPAALAQDAGRRLAEAAIEFTETRLEQARALLAEQPSERGTAELALAADLQLRARSALSASQFEAAMRLTREARLRADRVIATIRGLPDPSRVEAQIDRTRQVLERAREGLQGCDEPRARALLRVAIDMQARAEASYDEGRYLASLQLTMSARERGEKALRLCDRAEGVAEAAERALRQTDDLLLRAGETVAESSSDAAQALLARAQAAQADAWREFRSERAAAALRSTQNARLLAQRAMRIASRTGSGTR